MKCVVQCLLYSAVCSVVYIVCDISSVSASVYLVTLSRPLSGDGYSEFTALILQRIADCDVRRNLIIDQLQVASFFL